MCVSVDNELFVCGLRVAYRRSTSHFAISDQCDHHDASNADVPWNWHVAKRNQPTFTGDRDLAAFLKLAQKHDMLVVLRAGPYMCGEWEFGGLPAWLFENGSIPIRTDKEPYVARVTVCSLCHFACHSLSLLRVRTRVCLPVCMSFCLCCSVRPVAHANSLALQVRDARDGVLAESAAARCRPAAVLERRARGHGAG